MAISPQKTETAGYTVTPETIANLMISFIESGDPVTNGWCGGVTLETPGSAIITDHLWYADKALWAADDWMIRVLEDEDESGDPDQCKAHLISRAEFQKGLQLLAQHPTGGYGHHFRNIVTGDEDAGTADILMQMIVFGEETYA